MRLAVTQPYFFPYSGIFSLAHSADRFIIFDTAQYTRRSWMSRNRILSKEKGWGYINAGAVDSGFKCQITEVTVSDDDGWKQQILNKLKVYGRLRNYESVVSLVHDIIYSETKTLAELDALSMSSVMNYLGLSFKCEFMSEMNLEIADVNVPGDWSLKISEALGASEYINTPAGRDIFDEDAFIQRGIKLSFIDPCRDNYYQGGGDFIPYLSIIDTLMWNSKERCAEIISEGYRVMNKREIAEAWK